MKNESSFLPRPEHPEPMMRRDSWQNLNGEWLFAFDYSLSGRERGLFLPKNKAAYPQTIIVPFCPESPLSGIGETDFIPAVWYKRPIWITGEQLRGKVLLHFGAVDYETAVYVNGQLAGEHIGGYSSFMMDITAFLQPGENDLTVFARDDLRSRHQPSGKQSHRRDSYSCMYTRTTGIWQTVWLEFVPNGYIRSARYYADIREGALELELSFSKAGKITAEAFYQGKPMGTYTENTRGNTARFRLPLAETHLWEAGHGRLYDLKFTFESGGETDILYSYAGLREVKIDGFRVRINGKSVFQRTVLDQGFYPDGIYTAPSDAALKQDIELAMRLGFNGARLHEKIFEPRFLYHCDQAGYLVWGEHANWGLDITEKQGLAAFLPEWVEAVERDFNHPAIIGWCPFNETWDLNGRRRDPQILETVYHVTKAIDSTRPVIDASGGFHVISDLYDQHDYNQNPETFRQSYSGYNGKQDSFHWLLKEEQNYLPDLPLFISEFGGIKWVPEALRGKEEADAWGYGAAPKTEEEFFARYEGLTAALLENPNIMGFCYTQLYDVEQERNGLYTYAREAKFADYSRILAANTKNAAIEA